MAAVGGWRPAGTSHAGEYHVVPFLDVTERFDSNYFMTASDRKSAFITMLAPGFRLTRQTEILDASLSGRLNGSAYSGGIGEARLDPAYNGAVRYAAFPRLSFQGSAAYAENAQPDRDLRTTGLVNTMVSRQVTRRDQAYSAGGAYSVSERVSVNLSGGLAKDRYDDPEFADSETRTVNLGVDHDLRRVLENARGRVSLGYGGYRFSGSTQEYYTATVGMSRAVDETWDISGEAGVQYRRTGTSGGDWIGRVTTTHRGDLFTGTFGYAHDRTLASGAGDTTRRNALQATGSWRIAETFSATAYAGYFRNRTGDARASVPPLRETTFEINPGIRYAITQDMALACSYGYTRIRSERRAGSTAERHSVILRFTVQHDLLD